MVFQKVCFCKKCFRECKRLLERSPHSFARVQELCSKSAGNFVLQRLCSFGAGLGVLQRDLTSGQRRKEAPPCVALLPSSQRFGSTAACALERILIDMLHLTLRRLAFGANSCICKSDGEMAYQLLYHQGQYVQVSFDGCNMFLTRAVRHHALPRSCFASGIVASSTHACGSPD